MILSYEQTTNLNGVVPTVICVPFVMSILLVLFLAPKGGVHKEHLAEIVSRLLPTSQGSCHFRAGVERTFLV